MVAVQISGEGAVREAITDGRPVFEAAQVDVVRQPEPVILIAEVLVVDLRRQRRQLLAVGDLVRVFRRAGALPDALPLGVERDAVGKCNALTGRVRRAARILPAIGRAVLVDKAQLGILRLQNGVLHRRKAARGRIHLQHHVRTHRRRRAVLIDAAIGVVGHGDQLGRAGRIHFAVPRPHMTGQVHRFNARRRRVVHEPWRIAAAVFIQLVHQRGCILAHRVDGHAVLRSPADFLLRLLVDGVLLLRRAVDAADVVVVLRCLCGAVAADAEGLALRTGHIA